MVRHLATASEHHLPVWLLGLLLLAVPALEAPAQVRILPESRMWIEGTSTVDRFACMNTRFEVALRIDGAAAERETRTGAVSAEALLPVTSFDCGHRRMNHDLQEALRAEAHPYIRYELDQLRPLESGDADPSWQHFRATGQVTVAGVTRRVEQVLQARRLDNGRLRATGSVELRMTDFGIEPPSTLFGLIRAEDTIVVVFDLWAEAEPPLAARLGDLSP